MKTMLSKVMLMAVLAALMSFAAAAPALAEEEQLKPPGPIVDPVVPPVVDPDPPDPPDKGPLCSKVPDLCDGAGGGVLDPGTNAPPEPPKPPDPPKPPEECKYGEVKDKDGKCVPKGTDNNGGVYGTDGGYDGGSNNGGGYGGGDDYGDGDGIVYRGVTYINSLLPSTFTTTVENAGNSVKSNLPAPVAKTLPNTGGGWTTLALAGGALLLAGRFLVRRFSS